MICETSSQWSEENWRSEILQYQLKARSNLVRNLAEKLEHSGDFPTDTPAKLCQLIKNTASILEKYASSTPADQLSNVSYFICAIAEHLRFVERSRTPNTPWSMIQATELFLKRQAGNDSHFIVRPQWAYNYSLLGDFVETYKTSTATLTWIPFQEWESLIGDIANEKIYCIAFPRIERLNVLLHANWGHEVGHIIADSWIKTKFNALWSGAKNRIKARIEKEVRQNPPPVAPLFKETIIQNIVADKMNATMEATRQGFKELICDAIGVHLLGPAALAAATEFSAAFSLDESPLSREMYPPWRYRLRLMAEACEEDLQEHKKEGASNQTIYPSSVVKPFWIWLAKTKHVTAIMSDKASLDAEATTREAYKVIEKNWDKVQEEAIRLLPKESSKPYRLFERVTIIVNFRQNQEM